ncbi:MAG: hypothetical protein H6842_07730 [Rhodospirillaceae bacterium]|nr:hypothetical protein [Rhodospirillaceae bacterium]
MPPLIAWFAVATVAGVGATLGHRLAKDHVIPWAERQAKSLDEAAERVSRWAEKNRRREYQDFAEPGNGNGDAPTEQPAT